MADAREAILDRLLTVLQSVTGLETCARNLDDLADVRLPVALLFDGDEQAFDNTRARGLAGNTVEMTPTIEVSLGETPENVGTQVNVLRARIQAAVLGDATLAELCGKIPNSGARYIGMRLELATGRASVAKLILSFAINYSFNPRSF